MVHIPCDPAILLLVIYHSEMITWAYENTVVSKKISSFDLKRIQYVIATVHALYIIIINLLQNRYYFLPFYEFNIEMFKIIEERTLSRVTANILFFILHTFLQDFYLVTKEKQ